MKSLSVAGLVLVVAMSAPVAAQVQTVERAANGQPGKDIQLAVYLNVQPDCTSGPLPSIQLGTPPGHGNVSVKRANVTATNYKKCLAIQVPAFVAFYRSRPDFAGVDVLTLEVKYPQGRTEIQRISVTVAGPEAGPGQRI
jgi:hypothetical protein